jgi:hypothetical protein
MTKGDARLMGSDDGTYGVSIIQEDLPVSMAPESTPRRNRGHRLRLDVKTNRLSS